MSAFGIEEGDAQAWKLLVQPDGVRSLHRPDGTCVACCRAGQWRYIADDLAAGWNARLAKRGDRPGSWAPPEGTTYLHPRLGREAWTWITVIRLDLSQCQPRRDKLVRLDPADAYRIGRSGMRETDGMVAGESMVWQWVHGAVDEAIAAETV